MIEPRNKHKQTRKFKVKYQQKRAFREFEEKMDKEIKADEARDAKQRKIQQQQKKEWINSKQIISALVVISGSYYSMQLVKMGKDSDASVNNVQWKFTESW